MIYLSYIFVLMQLTYGSQFYEVWLMSSAALTCQYKAWNLPFMQSFPESNKLSGFLVMEICFIANFDYNYHKNLERFLVKANKSNQDKKNKAKSTWEKFAKKYYWKLTNLIETMQLSCKPSFSIFLHTIWLDVEIEKWNVSKNCLWEYQKCSYILK